VSGGHRDPLDKALSGELGALRWALRQDTDDAGANHLLIIMGWRANTSWEFFMSLKKASALVGCHVRTVQRKIEHLLLRGYIEDISWRYPKRRAKTYRLCKD
jgi:hypothetical protein